MNNNQEKKQPPLSSLTEILQDSFYFSMFLHLKRQLTNIEAKNYMVMFIKGLSVLFNYELLLFFEEYQLLKDKDFFKTIDKNTIMQERQWVHQSIINSDSMSQKMHQMGLNFNDTVYDMNIIVNSTNNLLDMNFEIFNENTDLKFWNTMFSIPEIASDALIKASTNDIFSLNNILDAIDKTIQNFEEKNKNYFNINRYSYSSKKLFEKTTSLLEKDKIFILYRYRLIHSIIIIEEMFKHYNLDINIKNIIQFNFKNYIRKIKALIIVIVGNDLQKMNTKFSNKLLEQINCKITNKNFFVINRTLRNNVHYSKTTILNNNEIDILDENQDIYLSILYNAIIEEININIDNECKQMTLFLKECKLQGLTEDEIKKDYEKKYLNFLYTGKIFN